MDVVEPKALDASMLLKTSYCHGHCNGCSSSDWLYRWITHARRASLTLLVLSGIIIYCIPQARTPAKKGCHLLIDLVASSLKIIIGRVDETEQIKIVDDSTETSTFSKDKVDSPEQIQDCLKKLESLPLYPLIEYIPKHEDSKDSKKHNVSFSVSEKKKKRHKKQYLQNESDWLERRKAFCEIHKPCEMKFKEKSSEKFSVRPSPLMQLDTFERQKFNEDSGLANHKVHERRRNEKISNVHQSCFELHPQHFSNNDSHSCSDLSYFENIGSLNQDPFDDVLIHESFSTTPRSIGNPVSIDEKIKSFDSGESTSRPTKTMSWLSDQIHKFRRSLMTLSLHINENIGILKDINCDGSQSPEFTTNNSVKSSTIDKGPPKFTNQSSNTTQSVLISEKGTHESGVNKEGSKLSCILGWIFGEAKHSSEAKEKKISKIVKQKFL